MSKPNTPSRKWTDSDDAMLLKLHYEGKSQKDIAEVVGRRSSSVHTRLSKLRYDGRVKDPPIVENDRSANARRGSSKISSLLRRIFADEAKVEMEKRDEITAMLREHTKELRPVRCSNGKET